MADKEENSKSSSNGVFIEIILDAEKDYGGLWDLNMNRICGAMELLNARSHSLTYFHVSYHPFRRADYEKYQEHRREIEWKLETK